MRNRDGAQRKIGGLPCVAIRLTRAAVAKWLVENNSLIGSAFRSTPTFFPLIGGSLVEGLMTIGSDLDFCMMVDGNVTEREVGALQPCFRRSMSELDSQLKRIGLSGLCRVSRRIRIADGFLGLQRCHESRAAALMTGVRLNYVLSCELLYTGVGGKKLRFRLANERTLRALKRRLYGNYRKALGCPCVPVLAYVLKRPGSYTPARWAAQVQLAINGLALIMHGFNGISGTVYDKAPKVAGAASGKVADSSMGTHEPVADRDAFRPSFDLIRRLKRLASTDVRIRRKSFNYLVSKGYVGEADWKRACKLSRCLLRALEFSGQIGDPNKA